MSGHYSLRLDLLDEQIVDAEGRRFGRVDDLEISLQDGARAPMVESVLTGLEAYGSRIGGLSGSIMCRVAQRLRPREHPPGPVRIACSSITSIDEMVYIDKRLQDMPELATLEHWLSEHVVQAIPGSGSESD